MFAAASDEVTRKEGTRGRDDAEHCVSAETLRLRLLEAVVEDTPSLFGALDREFRFLAFNARFAAAFEAVYGRKPALGVDIRTLIAHLPDEQKKVEQAWGGAIAGQEREFTEEFGDANLERRVFEIRFRVLRDEDGQPLGAYQTVEDITEQRRRAEANARAEETLSGFFESAPMMMGVVELVDDDILHVRGNALAATFFGVAVDGMRLKRASELGVPRSTIDRWRARYLEAEATRGPVRFEYWGDAGAERRHHSVTVRLIGPGPTGALQFSYVIDDTTRQKLAEEALQQAQVELEARVRDRTAEIARQRDELLRSEDELRRSQQLTAAIAANATLGLIMMDATQRCTFMNPAAERITGFEFAEVTEKPLHDYLHHTRPDGTPYPMDECPIDRALPTRARERGEDVFIHKDGRFYPVAFTASPIVAGGQPIGTVIEVRDTTEEKETERKLREAVAVRDEFLTVASHELRTPLTALGLQLTKIGRQLVAPALDAATLGQSVTVAKRQAARLETLIEDLLNVSRIVSGRLLLKSRRFDLRELVSDISERLTEVASDAGCELRLQLGAPAEGVWDRERLDAVVTNLLSNAIKYAPGKPIELTVDADSTNATLRVRDHGIGVSTEAQTRIFGRFERAVSTTNFGGLGLGLFIARQIVEAHGGSIAVESVEGQGACFTVTLPRAAPAG